MHPMYKKLAAMSGMAVAFLAGKEADGQVLFHEYVPYDTLELEYWEYEFAAPFDIDQDGLTDMSIVGSSSFGLFEGLEVLPGWQVAGSFSELHYCYSETFGLPFTYSSTYIIDQVFDGDTINNDMIWDQEPNVFIRGADIPYLSGDMCYTGHSYDGYIPVRKSEADGIHYGFIRLKVGWGFAVIMETAYNLTPDEEIVAGAVYSDLPAHDLFAESISLTGSSADLILHADQMTDETALDHYRLYILPADSAGVYNTTELFTIPASNYLTWIPDGGPISISLPDEQVTLDGALMEPDSLYKFLIMHVMDEPSHSYLSEYSPTFLFTDHLIPAEITDVQDEDMACTPTTILFSFDSPFSTFGISEYRAYLVPEGAAFTAVSLFGLPSAQYTTFPEDGSGNYTVSLDPDQLDSEGNDVYLGANYSLVLLTISDLTGIEPELYSVEDIQFGKDLNSVTELVAADEGRMENASDIHVSLKQVSSSLEDHILTYRIMVQTVDDPIVEDEVFLDPASETYMDMSTAPSSTVSTELDENMLLWDGSSLTDSTYLQVLVASVPSDDCYLLSYTVSDPFLYIGPASAVESLTVTDSLDHGNAGDIHISFNAAPQQSRNMEYRVFPVRPIELGVLDVDSASVLTEEHYLSFDASAMTYGSFLNEDVTDFFGNDLHIENTYYLYVLSIAIPSRENTLSEQFGPFSFNPELVVTPTLSDQNIYSDERDPLISFSPVMNGSPSAYRIFLVPEADTSTISGDMAAGVSPYFYVTTAPGEPYYEVSWQESRFDIFGEPIGQGIPYVATVMAYDNSQVHQYLSDFSNAIVLDFSSGMNYSYGNEFQLFQTTQELILKSMDVTHSDEIFLRDLTGRNTGVTVQRNSDQYVLSVQSLPAGMYILELRRNGSIYTWKVVIP